MSNQFDAVLSSTWVHAVNSTASLSDLELACLHEHPSTPRDERDAAYIALHARRLSTSKLGDRPSLELLP